jgi:divalent metal cation (Fe/Co/Zn/Cd) transporter
LLGILKSMSANNNSVKSPRPVMRTATWLNVGYGILETVVGGSSGSSAALANGIHNTSDGVSHAMHTATHIQESNPEKIRDKVQNRRRWAAGAIAVGAVLTGAHSVNTLTDPVYETSINTQALAIELGAVGINTGLIIAIRRRKDETLAYKDAERHFYTDGTIAALTSTSIALTPNFMYADGIGGLIATGASAWLAYKTAKPLSHEHATESVV